MLNLNQSQPRTQVRDHSIYLKVKRLGHTKQDHNAHIQVLSGRYSRDQWDLAPLLSCILIYHIIMPIVELVRCLVSFVLRMFNVLKYGTLAKLRNIHIW